jgi:hypothetical protein
MVVGGVERRTKNAKRVFDNRYCYQLAVVKLKDFGKNFRVGLRWRIRYAVNRYRGPHIRCMAIIIVHLPAIIMIHLIAIVKLTDHLESMHCFSIAIINTCSVLNSLLAALYWIKNGIRNVNSHGQTRLLCYGCMLSSVHIRVLKTCYHCCWYFVFYSTPSVQICHSLKMYN